MNERIDNEFTVRIEDLATDLRCLGCNEAIVRRVVHLYRDGVLVRTTDGTPAEYVSEQDATYVARHWDAYGAIPISDLSHLSDDELTKRADRIAVLDSER